MGLMYHKVMYPILNKKQIDRLIEELVKTNPNFKPSTFRSAITIYRNASSGGI